jgi:hypothetical protein
VSFGEEQRGADDVAGLGAALDRTALDDAPSIPRSCAPSRSSVCAVAEGAGISFIALGRSRNLRIPGAAFRRFTAPEPTVGIALAWRRGTPLPVVAVLREIARSVAKVA